MNEKMKEEAMNQQIYGEALIIDLGDGGQGIAKADGLTIFLDGGIPGDKISYELTEIKKNYAKGNVIEILHPSKDRTEPPCPYEGDCGGCGLQNMNYQAQLALKQKWVKDRLQRIGSLENPKVLDILSMENPTSYRNKVQFPISRVSGEEKKERGCNVGFYRAKSHDVINVDTCMVQSRAANAVARVIRRYVKEAKVPVYDSKEGTGVLRHVVVRTASGTGEVMVILVATQRQLPELEWLVSELRETFAELSDPMTASVNDKGYRLRSLILNLNKERSGETLGRENVTLFGQSTITDRLVDLEFEISPLSFYQVNPIQTERLYRKVKEYAGLTGNETVLDLYCGVGTIGLYLASDAKKVIGIESVRAAVLDANRNATINGIVNAEFIKGKAEEALPRLLDQGVKADVVVLDPPRAGCNPALLSAVAEAGPSRIVYVSCDPATLARDIKILGGLGYEFVEAQPVDMFAHALHVETVVLMSRAKE